MPPNPQRRTDPDVDTLVAGLRSGRTDRLARAITLVESRARRHREPARRLMRAVLPHAGGSRRIGLTGVPGAGKSTFIEAFGLRLCEAGRRVAVLAVDPTSTRSGGSILGDKTRMEALARHPNAFIRPSPSGEHPGGVAARTREALLLCEAAGFDDVLVETVGVGQGETAVRTMTDCFLLLQIAGAGDDLQGIKRGVIELADAIVVNKADGDNVHRANQARSEYARVLHYLTPYTPDWTPSALTCSALEGDGLDAVAVLLERFFREKGEDGTLAAQRGRQNLDWFRSLLRQEVMERYLADQREQLAAVETAVMAGELPVAEALDRLMPEGQ
ncbi:MAG: methylmalonyl Co-A mutase-associated GTPase MeaB [Opitutales bacterium]